jgi:hypothetical protein
LSGADQGFSTSAHSHIDAEPNELPGHELFDPEASELTAEAGDLVFKPRNQWHTFWNAGDRGCRILEIVSPGGFEHCFDEMAGAMASPDFDPQQMAEIAGRYGLELQPESIPALCAEHGLTHPMLQASH